MYNTSQEPHKKHRLLLLKIARQIIMLEDGRDSYNESQIFDIFLKLIEDPKIEHKLINSANGVFCREELIDIMEDDISQVLVTNLVNDNLMKSRKEMLI